MLYDYLVFIKNDRGRYINTVSQLLCLISAAFFLQQEVKAGLRFNYFLASFCLIIVGLVWNRYLFLKKDNIIYYRRILVLAGATWLCMPYLQWVGIPLIFLAVIEKHSRLPLEIGVTNDRIVFNTLIKRGFNWTALNNMVLKDGMLTIDFKTNRLFQKEIVEDISRVEEAEFNDYCKKCLEKAASELSGS